MGLTQITFSQIKINEYSVSNTNNFAGVSFPDNTGSRSDWVEFFNPTTTAINISGWNLTDNPTNLTKYAFPSVSIPANGFIRVWCSGKGSAANAGNHYHTNFKLTQCEGDWIILSNAGVIEDSLQLRITKSNHSRGRKPDGSANWKVFTTANPNATNNSATAFDGYVATPVLSLAAGFYSGAQSVSLNCATPSATVYYTTNGAEPLTTSTIYASAVAINTTTVLRAFAVSSNTTLLQSFMETNTYFINENINSQYGVVSISGGTALLSLLNGSQSNPKTHFEYFDAGQFKTETYGIANKHGNDSWAYDQRGIDFETEDDYGYNNALKHTFFTDAKQGYSSRKKFQHVILKAAASDNFPGDKPTKSCHMRDAFVQTYAFRKNLELDGRRNKHSIVFLNGQYWGIYELREAFEEDYTDYYYNQPSIMNLQYWGSYVNSPPTAWQNDWANLYNYVMSNPMTNATNYAHVDSALSFKSLIDYMVYNSYVVNTDFINWNTAWWRGTDVTKDKHKWRYWMWDMDNVYDLGENFSGIPSTDMTASPCDYTNVFQNAGPQEGHPDILDKLLTNPAFKSMYINRYADLLNSAFNCDSIMDHYNYFKNILTPEMPRHIAKWGNGNTLPDWNTNMTRLQTKIQQRCGFIESTIESCYNVVAKPLYVNVVPTGAGNVKLNTIWLNNFGWTGTYFSGVDMTFAATPYNSALYEFDYWEFNNHTPLPNINSDTATISFATQDSVIAHFKLKTNLLPLVVDVVPAGAGNVNLNNLNLNTFIYTGNYALNTNMTFIATPFNASLYDFDYWEFNNHTPLPNINSNTVTINYTVKDTVVAHFKLKNIVPTPTITPTNTIALTGSEIIYPTAFTPNGDGKNDVLFTLGGTNATNLSVEIWNRWGERVFVSHDVDDGWDGTYKGTAAQIGVYSYYIKYVNFEGDDKTVKGSFTLIR